MMIACRSRSHLAFTRSLALVFGLLHLLGLSLAASASGPNILVIMTDEHNASVLGCYGNKIIRTPNLDRLASRGVVFDAAYTPSPLCVPCRQSFTAGKYVSRIGTWNNSCKLPPDTPSIARVMNSAGYESFLCGKMHYDRSCRYGFTEIGGNMNNSLMKGGVQRRAPDDLKSIARGQNARFHDFHTGDSSSILDHDRRVTAGAVEFLSHRPPPLAVAAACVTVSTADPSPTRTCPA